MYPSEPSRDYSLESYDDEESGTSCPTLAAPKTGRGNIQFAAETAAITGQSKRDINRNVARAEAIGPDILKLSGTSLDKGVLYQAWPGDTAKPMKPRFQRIGAVSLALGAWPPWCWPKGVAIGDPLCERLKGGCNQPEISR